MAYKKNSSVSSTKSGVRSPMCGYEQQQNRRAPSTAGTTEMIPGSAPRNAAKLSSPTKPKNPGRSN